MNLTKLSLACIIMLSSATAMADGKHPRLTEFKEKTVNAFNKTIMVDAKAAQEAEIKDPLEKLNRKVFAFNDTLDHYVAKPIANQYDKKVPEDVRGSYRAFRKNLGEPWNAVNQLLQGKPLRAAKTLGRFTINTLTTLGFADPATRIGLETEDESFGTTLGYYGVPSGAYIMLPFFGPSTVRDTFGFLVDSQTRPQGYLLDGQEVANHTLTGLTAVDVRSKFLDIEKALPEQRDEKYSALRDAYLQAKAFEILEKKGETLENAFIDEVDETEDSATTPDVAE